MKTISIIPARGGSKGVPRKNIRELAGKPLIAYSIEEALKVKKLDRVCVSTEDAEIAEVAIEYGAEVLKRPVSLAGDYTQTREVLWFHIKELAQSGYHPDAVMTLQPTSPMRTARNIEEALVLFSRMPDADSLVSCVEVPHNFHPLSVMKTDEEGYLLPYFDQLDGPLRRQNKSVVLARNGAALYLTRTPKLADFVFGGKLVPYMMKEDESVDIDSEADFERAEKLLIKKNS
tara:strand:- start:414 stop:1109 length:696 start_codon:yes stop_codon:yes gene_type:complete